MFAFSRHVSHQLMKELLSRKDVKMVHVSGEDVVEVRMEMVAIDYYYGC
jgi:hypothetical protein